MMDAYISTVVDLCVFRFHYIDGCMEFVLPVLLELETLSVSDDYSDVGRMLRHNTVSKIKRTALYNYFINQL